MTDSRLTGVYSRIRLVSLAGLVAMCVIILRLHNLQVVNQASPEAAEEKSKGIKIKLERGYILDRNRHVLVMNKKYYNICAYPADVVDPNQTAAILIPILDKPVNELLEHLDIRRFKMKHPFRILKKHVDFDVAAAIKEKNLPGIEVREEPGRSYVKGSLAGQLIGYVDSNNEGQDGIERAVDDEIKRRGVFVEARDAWQKNRVVAEDYVKGKELRSSDAILAIDETIQWITEKALNEMCQYQNAKAGMAIVLDPATGDVLSMANYPPFNPDKLDDKSIKDAIRNSANQCILYPYEPGSTFKPFIVASALDCGAVKLEDTIDCENGSRYIDYRLRRKPIRDDHRLGVATITDVVVHSSNIGAGKIAEKIVNLEPDKPSKERFYNYMRDFGFDRISGIDLVGEKSQALIHWSRMNLHDLLVVSFGGGPISVTAIGMASAYGALANHGLYVRPHVVHSFLSRNLVEYPAHKIDESTQVISAKVAGQVCNMLYEVVERGTGQRAQSEYYKVGGKTGTAKKSIGKAGYSDGLRLLSFAGIAPIDNPKIVCVVMIDEPRVATYGGQAAAPVFREIVDKTLAYLRVPPDFVPARKTKYKSFYPIETPKEVEPAIDEPVDNDPAEDKEEQAAVNRSIRDSIDSILKAKVWQ